MFIWNKTRNGKPALLPGTYSDTSTEELKIATRGSPLDRCLNSSIRVPQVVSAEVGRHSAKPIEIMKLINAKFALDKMKSLEIFARNRTLAHFDLYGDELTPRF